MTQQRPIKVGIVGAGGREQEPRVAAPSAPGTCLARSQSVSRALDNCGRSRPCLVSLSGVTQEGPITSPPTSAGSSLTSPANLTPSAGASAGPAGGGVR